MWCCAVSFVWASKLTVRELKCSAEIWLIRTSLKFLEKNQQMKAWWIPVIWWETSNRNSTPGHPLIGPSWILFSQPWVFQGLSLRCEHTKKKYMDKNRIISGSFCYLKCWWLEHSKFKMPCFSCLQVHLIICWSSISVDYHLDVFTDSQYSMCLLCLKGTFSSQQRWGKKKSQGYRDLKLELQITCGFSWLKVCSNMPGL